MFIEVNKIPRDGLEVDRLLPLPPILLSTGEKVPVEGARLQGNLRRRGSDVDFRGRVEAILTLACSRCLVPVRVNVEGPCYRIFRPGPMGRPESERELGEDDLALTPFDGGRIDMGEIALEQIYLAVPLKPLCKDGCRGLCPHCGAERNSGPCGCPEDKQEAVPLTSKLSL